MTGEKLSIFIGLTRSSYGYFLSIRDLNRTNILVDVNGLYSEKYGEDGWNIFMNAKYRFSKYKIINKLREYRCKKQVIKELDFLIQKTDFEINVYYQTLEDLIGNYFFFSKKFHGKISFFLVEDGLLNYLPEKFPFKRVIALYLQKIILMYFKVPFRIPYDGNYKGINFLFISDERCKEVYVRYPNKSLHRFSHKVRKLVSPEINYKPIPNRVLLIGQEPLSLRQFLGEEFNFKFFELLDKMVEILPPNCSIYYKMHNLKDNRTFDIGNYQGYNGLQFNLINSLEPVEEIIDKLCPQLIFGFESTALFNLKMSMNNQIDVRIFGFPVYNPYVESLFKEIGIEILNNTEKENA